MSNSAERGPVDLREKSLTADLRTKLLVTLALAFLIELISRLMPALSHGNELLSEALSITAIVLTGTSIAILISRIRGGRAVRWFMIVATASLFTSILFHIFDAMPVLDNVELLGRNSKYHGLLTNLTDLTGIAAWITGFFWMVFDVESTRAKLAEQHRDLRAQVAEKERAETVLRESEGRFRAVFENVPANMLLMSPQGRLIECNSSLVETLGYSQRQLHQTNLETLVYHEDRNAFRAALETVQTNDATTQYLETRLIGGDETVLEVGITTTLVRPDKTHAGILVAVLENLSTRRIREEQIQRRQKMESLELLAGGIAHDFNNLLVGVMANADHLSRILESNEEHFQICVEIVQSGQRAAELCHQLLAYAGKAPCQEKPVDLTELVEGSRQLLCMAMAPEATFVFEGTTPLPSISADPALIRQVLLSLISNASDALQSNPGRISVSTGVQLLSPQDFAQLLHRHTPEPGEYVYLQVSDTGTGLPEDAINRLFDPFFTTKHHGSGLGLAAVLGIVYSHRGLLSLKSQLGEGTTIRIYFRPVHQQATPTATESSPARPTQRKNSGAATILVVDDEELVRLAARRVLEHSGYKVLCAVDGQEGVEIFQASHTTLAAVLLDLTMPRMDGETAWMKMKEIDPEVPIILSSGYSESDSASPAIFREVTAYLRKPYRIKQLLDILNEVT